MGGLIAVTFTLTAAAAAVGLPFAWKERGSLGIEFQFQMFADRPTLKEIDRVAAMQKNEIRLEEAQ